MIYYFTRFKPGQSKNGGDRRVEQISSLFGDQLKLIAAHNHLPSPITFKKFLNSLFFSFNYFQDYLFTKTLGQRKSSKYWNEKPKETYILNRRIAHNWSRIFGKDNPTYVIVDDPIYFKPIIKIFKKRNIKVIGVLHNLESLVPDQAKEFKQHKLFNYELKCLRMCDGIITISYEEEFILKNFSFKSILIPYFPIKPVTDRIETIKNARKNTIKKHLFMFGSFYNYPTALGIIEFSKKYSSAGMEKIFGKLIIGGNRIEKYKNDLTFPGVEIIENLSDEKLDTILSETNAVVVFQEKAAGALTKLSELILSEVPVIANQMAARSFYHFPGIFIFNDINELAVIKKKIDNSGFQNYQQETISDFFHTQDWKKKISDLINS